MHRLGDNPTPECGERAKAIRFSTLTAIRDAPGCEVGELLVRD